MSYDPSAGQTPPPQNPPPAYSPSQYSSPQNPPSQYPQAPYPQPGAIPGDHGRPPQFAAPTRVKRPVWRIIVGTILVVLGALALLGTLVNLATGGYRGGSGEFAGFYLLGQLIGFLLFIGLPLSLGILLLALPGRRRE